MGPAALAPTTLCRMLQDSVERGDFRSKCYSEFRQTINKGTVAFVTPIYTSKLASSRVYNWTGCIPPTDMLLSTNTGGSNTGKTSLHMLSPRANRIGMLAMQSAGTFHAALQRSHWSSLNGNESHTSSNEVYRRCRNHSITYMSQSYKDTESTLAKSQHRSEALHACCCTDAASACQTVTGVTAYNLCAHITARKHRVVSVDTPLCTTIQSPNYGTKPM